jgi:hypothetical protein
MKIIGSVAMIKNLRMMHLPDEGTGRGGGSAEAGGETDGG